MIRAKRCATSARLAALAAVFLSGCASSPPIEFFSLEPIDVHEPALTSSRTVQIARVHVPSALDRTQMVRHDGPYTLDISDRHRWSAPLDEMVRRVLSQDLLRMLPANRVVLPEEPATAATENIVVGILEFSPDSSSTIRFEATWTLMPAAPDEQPRRRYVRLSESAEPNDAADQVRAMSRILDQLAAQMAHALGTPQI